MLWEDTLSCGHDRLVEIAIDLDRSIRVGEPTVCYQCGPRNADVTITAVRLVSNA